MVYSSDITTISTTGTLSYAQDVYLVDASGGGFTITLPDIATGSNGIHYKLKRIDTTVNVVTIQGFNGSQTIDGATSITILPSSIMQLEAYEALWYVLDNSSTVRSDSKALFTTALVQNNGKPYITFSGGNTPSIVCLFYYPGVDAEIISKVTLILSAEGGNPIGAATVLNSASQVVASLNYDLTTLTPTIITTTTISNLPSTPDVFSLYVQHTGSVNKLNIYSVTVQ
jgi:hypothetical protein